jgi:hypothetical protein
LLSFSCMLSFIARLHFESSPFLFKSSHICLRNYSKILTGTQPQDAEEQRKRQTPRSHK